MRFEAFACHYLTDSFSAGHLRVPRKALHDIGKDWDAKAQHDEDGRLGLEVEDHSGQKWRTFGDDQLIDSKGKKNEDELKKIAYGKVRDATTRAIKDIWESYKTQCQITKVYTLMLKEPCASNNHYAMFKIDNGVLKKRTGKENEGKYENYPPKGGCMIL